MAVTSNLQEPKRIGDLRQGGYQPQQQTAKKQDGYSGIAGVSQGTAQKMGEYQKGYQQGDAATQAQQSWQDVQLQKPQGYTSKYQGALDNILQQIQNPQDFKYEFNGDNLFKQYADMYNQMGQQASLNSMGQAAGLTGGYGNSYAAQVGNQAYQQQLLGLYDKGLELRDRAYQQYQDKLQGQKDAYSMLASAEDRAYGQYRDELGDWQRGDDRAYDRSVQERQMDYDQYKDMLDYYTGLAQIENGAYNTEADRQEAIRQFEQQFAEQRRQSDLDEAYRRDTLTEQQRQYDLDADYRSQQFDWQKSTDQRDYDERVRQADLDEAYRQMQLEWQKEIDQRDFDWKEQTDLRDYASQYVLAMLEKGQMPGADLLALAGISEEDAKKLKKKKTTTKKPKDEENPNQDEDKGKNPGDQKGPKNPIIDTGDGKQPKIPDWTYILLD